jgi:hypothetical protein
MASSGMLRRVALVRTDVSEELSAFFIRVTRIGELATTLAVTRNRRTLRRYTNFNENEQGNRGTAPPFLISALEEGGVQNQAPASLSPRRELRTHWTGRLVGR